MFCVRGVTILTSSMKSSARLLRAACRSFTERRNKSGRKTESCGTPLLIGMVPKSSIQKFSLETRLVRNASIHHKTKDFIFAKRNVWSKPSSTIRVSASPKTSKPELRDVPAGNHVDGVKLPVFHFHRREGSFPRFYIKWKLDSQGGSLIRCLGQPFFIYCAHGGESGIGRFHHRF